MTTKLTESEIQDWQRKIRRMGYEEMAVLWRFAPAGHPCFNNKYPQLHGQFDERFNNYFNGMRAGVSKDIGWDRKRWIGKYGLPEELPE